MKSSVTLVTIFGALFALTSGPSMATTYTQAPVKVKPDFTSKVKSSPRAHMMIAAGAQRFPGDMFDPNKKQISSDKLTPSR